MKRASKVGENHEVLGSDHDDEDTRVHHSVRWLTSG